MFCLLIMFLHKYDILPVTGEDAINAHGKEDTQVIPTL